MTKNKVSLMEIKQALLDSRFRESLPPEIKNEVTSFLSNPSCPCNIPLYRKVLKECREQLMRYFPEREIHDELEDIKKVAENKWKVINCNIHDLQSEVRKLPNKRVQIAVSRYEEEVTAIANIVVGDIENNWSVVNCLVDEIEDKLKMLSLGRKQIAVARYKDQATILINELTVIY
jgi:hypothetical protein